MKKLVLLLAVFSVLYVVNDAGAQVFRRRAVSVSSCPAGGCPVVPMLAAPTLAAPALSVVSEPTEYVEYVSQAGDTTRKTDKPAKVSSPSKPASPPTVAAPTVTYHATQTYTRTGGDCARVPRARRLALFPLKAFATVTVRVAAGTVRVVTLPVRTVTRGGFRCW